MDLYKIIPQNNNWTISKNIVYVNYIARIPILIKNGNDVWVYLDIKVLKHVLKIVDILNKNNINFLFKSTSIFFDHKFREDEIHNLNLNYYISNISNPMVFDGMQKIGFDYTKNLTSYLIKYECYDIFKSVYKKQSKRLLSKDFDYWSNKEFFITKREDIRSYISSLEREVKINLLF